MHDEGAVAVRLLRERVKLGNGIVESLFGEMASAVRRIQNLIVEDTEVEREAKTDGMCWSELSLCDIGGILVTRLDGVLSLRGARQAYLVSLVGGGGSNLAFFTRGELSEVSMIVSLPVVVR